MRSLNNRDNLYKQKMNNKGFTLVELIVTMVVLSVVLALSTWGILAWMDWSNFNKENEYAQILFVAGQNQLSQDESANQLKVIQEQLELAGQPAVNAEGPAFLHALDITQIKDENGNLYVLDDVFPNSKNKAEDKKNLERHQMINYSIIIPHKNISQLLERCLRSIPSREDLEIIVVDDNSSHEEIANIKHFQSQPDIPDFLLLLTSEGKGAGFARNRGVERAKGKWVVFADAGTLTKGSDSCLSSASLLSSTLSMVGKSV